MKKLVLIAIAAALILTSSCTIHEYYGSGNMVTEERYPRLFDGVHVDGAMEVHLIQDNRSRVVIEADELLLPSVLSSVSNGVLYLTMESSYRYAGNSVKIWIYAPDVYEIRLDGSGEIITDNRHNFKNYLYVTNNGSGYIELRGTARTTDVTINGSGDIRLVGSGTYISVEHNASGYLRAFDFNVDEAIVSTYGSGDCQLNVWNYLSTKIGGSGNVIYEGSPRVEVIRNGSGVVRRR